MQKIFSLLIICMFSANILSQTAAVKMTGILNSIGKNMPADQLFLHLDRNLYNTGDTIRFQAFIRDRQTGVIETPSISLYVLLLNSDHNTVDSARFRISYSTASGWLKVPELTALGNYSILAYTSDQMNYSPEFAFRTPVRIDKIGTSQSEADSLIIQSQTVTDLRFLPEGGTYIYGIRQRLAFNAVTSTGKSVRASGDIVDQVGKKIIDFKSGPYGPGVVEFTPVQGETYYAKPVEAEFGNMSWPLPEPEKSGVSLRVNNTKSGSLDIAVSGNGTGGKDFFLTVTMNNTLIFSRELKLDTLFNARIKTAEIPAGTAFVTLYDNELNPVAERMIFLNGDKKMKVQISVSKPNTRPGSETELTINTTDEKANNISSIISVSAIDSSLGFYNGIPYCDIESLFLYDNEFYNNLPQRIRCSGLKNIDNKTVDLLMMTYGWRKYTLKESVLVNHEKRSDNYDHLKISNPGKDKKSREVINVISPEGGELITLNLNENKETLLTFDSLDVMARQIMILPDDDPSRNSNPVNIEFPENRAYTDNARLMKSDSSYFEPELVSANNEMSLFNPDSSIMIDAVTIKGQKKKPTFDVEKNAERFKYAGTYTLTNKDFIGAITFEDIIPFFHPSLVKNRQIYLSSRRFLDWKNPDPVVLRPALVVVDDVPIFNKSYSQIAQMPASEIASVTILRGVQGFSLYGPDASNGVIFVTTKIGNRINGVIDPNDEFTSVDNHLKQVRLFRTEVEYYIPTKEQVESVTEYQFRPTLLWKSDVYLDGSGPVKFKYPNNLGKGTVMIFVNGVSLTNMVGSDRYNYSVK